MSRLMLLALACCAASMVAAEEKQSDRERRVKVALAIAVASTPAADGYAPDCGQCRHDEAEARAEAEKLRKPLALIIGHCEGRGKIANDAGAVACVVDQYAGDKTPRIVILEPRSGEWYIHGTLPADASAEKIKAAVGAATPKPPAQMPGGIDWYISAEAHAKPAEPAKAKRYVQRCENGVCRLVEVTD